jgi:hypothetical protein
LAYFSACGLVGAALGVVGLRLYWTIEEMENGPGPFFNRIELAAGLESVLWEAGLLLALAIGVYVLASFSHTASSTPSAQAVDQPGGESA